MSNPFSPLRYKLLAVDLDGTLLDRGGKVSPENRAALHRAHLAGLKVVVCTGRSFTETRPVLDQIGLDLDATITVGGALINDAATGRTLERIEIDDHLGRDVLQWFRGQGHSVLWLVDRDREGFDGCCIWHNHRHPAIDVWLTKSGCQMNRYDEPPAHLPRALRITIVDEPAGLEAVAGPLAAEFGARLTFNVIQVPLFGFAVIESFAGPVSKWAAVERLCRRWAIDPACTVAVGDDVNDLSMIQAAGLGVAMGNAIAPAKSAARLVVARHDEHGVAELIGQLLD